MAEVKNGKVENIVRVFMNKADDYTVISMNGKELKPVQLYGTTRLITDVPSGKLMYAEWRNYENKNFSELTGQCGQRLKAECEIHIHSAVDVNGGQWSETTSGKTRITITGKVKEIE